MLLGYNTNGFASHGLDDALAIIGGLGYRAVAITLDHHALSPWAPDLDERVARVRRLLDGFGLVPVIETGARFLLDPWHKHQPTLLSPGREQRDRRLDFLRRAIDVGADLGAFVVSLWSGTVELGEAAAHPDDGDLDQRLADGLGELAAHAADRGLVLGLEPEPGMHVASLADYERIRRAVAHPALRLTFDVGHAHLTERSVDAALRRALPDIVNVHLEGMARGRHEHLVPWEGDLDVGAALRALGSLGYAGPACFELSRHSHDAVEVARRACAFARDALDRAATRPVSRPAARARGRAPRPSPAARARRAGSTRSPAVQRRRRR